MKKLKVVLAILVVLFVSQSVFAAYRPASKADPKVTFDLAYSADVLQNLAGDYPDPVEFYMHMAGAEDDEVAWALSLLGYGPGYMPVTTTEDLEKLFPRGVEETDILNAFRRTALHLAMYTSRNGAGTGSAEVLPYAQEQFYLVGYNFEFELKDGAFFFKFVDAVGDEELNMIATVINRVIPGIEGFYYIRPGVIAAALYQDLTEVVFRTGVRALESMIYETIY